MSDYRRSIFPWWAWMWGVHTLFVGILYFYNLTSMRPTWFKQIFSSISLGTEENYAVWWSGICLFIAASLFYRVASAQPKFSESWRWIILSLSFLALSFDEIGSLHEIVATYFGWAGLAPFALIFGVGIGAALFSMFRQPGFRIAAFLIGLGILLFASVAGLEFVEHNIDLTRYQRRYRLILEEGTELLGMSLLIIAGLLCLRHLSIEQRKLSDIIGDPGSLVMHHQIIFILFALQFLIIAVFAVPYEGVFVEGNPASVFPIFMFFILFLMCFQKARQQTQKAIWGVMSLLFLATSLLQIQNIGYLLSKMEIYIPWGRFAPDTWIITFVPLLVTGLYVFFKKSGSIKIISIDCILVLGILIVLYPDNETAMIYKLFAGCVAFVCYRWLRLLDRSTA